MPHRISARTLILVAFAAILTSCSANPHAAINNILRGAGYAPVLPMNSQICRPGAIVVPGSMDPFKGRFVASAIHMFGSDWPKATNPLTINERSARSLEVAIAGDVGDELQANLTGEGQIATACKIGSLLLYEYSEADVTENQGRMSDQVLRQVRANRKEAVIVLRAAVANVSVTVTCKESLALSLEGQLQSRFGSTTLSHTDGYVQIESKGQIIIGMPAHAGCAPVDSIVALKERMDRLE